jgi:3-carboxy-cis,cis-muconate cycloisomerase
MVRCQGARPRDSRTSGHDGTVNEEPRRGLFSGLFEAGSVTIDDTAWLQAMLDTEAALARAAERAGLAPPGSGAAVTAIAGVPFMDNASLGVSAAAAGNPIPALVKALTALVPAESAQAIHLGATSQDIIDTAAMLLARQVIDATLEELAAAAESCAALTRDHAPTLMSGRTLLQQAVPITFGLVTAGWLVALDETQELLHRARARLAIQYGGAAGTLAPLGDRGVEVARLLGQELDLPVPVLPWHTNRLRLLEVAAALTAVQAALGKIARDVTLLSQTEVAELQESAPGGSSTMPHKQNPVAAIVLLGHTKQAPHLYAALAAAAEQELQRAAGAWHAEWQPLTHLLTLTTSASGWATRLLSGLRVDAAKMRANLELTHGLPLAEQAAGLLAPKIGRLQANSLVSRASARAIADGILLAEALCSDEETAAQLAAGDISSGQLRERLDPAAYLGSTAEFIAAALSAHASVSPNST